MTAEAGPANGSRPIDALVVGAGAIGLACAWRAAERGLRVRVLERDEPGAGASGVAAGMLAPVGEANWGEERFLAAALASHSVWPRFADALRDASGRDAGLIRNGALHVALDGDEARELHRRFELMQELGLEAEWVGAQACRDLEPGLTTALHGGVHAPHEAAVDPSEMVAALHAACQAAGVEVVAGTEVARVVSAGDRVRGVETASGERHEAGAVVLAAGAWGRAIAGLPEGAMPAVRPVKGQILTLRGPAEQPVAERIVVAERVYLVPRADGRLVVGATMEELGFDTRITAGGVHELLREAYRALPDVTEMEFERAVAGLRPGTPDNVPIVGRTELDGLIVATGHFRNGILLTPLTADAVVAHLCGERPPSALDVADPGRAALRAGEVGA